MGKFTNRLKAMQENWSNSASGFPEIPPGEYTMQISGAEIRESQTSGNLRAVFTYTIMDGEQAGETLMDGFTLDNEKPAGMRMLKGLLEKLGMEVPEDLADVESILPKVAKANLTVRAQVKKSGDFTNVKVLELLDEADATEEEAEAEEESPTEEEAAESAEAEEEAEEQTDEGEAEESGESEETEDEPTPKHGYKKGMRVSFRNGKETIIGTIVKVNGAMVTVETEAGDQWDDVPVQALKDAPATKKLAAPVKKAAAPVKKLVRRK